MKTYRFSCHLIIFRLFHSDDKVVMCAFLLLNLPCYWHSYTKGLYIKNKAHLHSILGKNLSYYPTLWLITSVGAWLVQMIPLFCGHEFKLTDSHVFINTHNLTNALRSKRTPKILNSFKCKQLITIYITQKCSVEQTHHNKCTFLTPMLKHTHTFDTHCALCLWLDVEQLTAMPYVRNTLKLKVNNQTLCVHQHHISRALRLVL